MKDLKGSKQKKFMEAFVVSQWQLINTILCQCSEKEGYEQISAIFSETQKNELEHAKLWFKYLNDIGKTAENLISAAEEKL